MSKLLVDNLDIFVMERNLFWFFFPNNLYVIILPGYNLQLALSDLLSLFLGKRGVGGCGGWK